VGTREADRKELIDEFRIAYVFYGPAERLLGDWAPSQAPYLRLFAEQGDYAVYEVSE
jgi:hypothetical protein